MLTVDKADRLRRGLQGFADRVTLDDDVLGGFASRIRPVIDYDAAAWMTVDPASLLFTDAMVEHLPGETCAPWFHNELAQRDVHKFRDLARGAGVGVLSQALDDPADSPRWNDVMRPIGLDAEVRLVLQDATGSWGTAELHRTLGRPDFTPEEADLLRDVGSIMAGALRRLSVERAAIDARGTDGPGLVHVSSDGSVTPMTDAGAAWLELLVVPIPGTAPTSVNALGALARDGSDHASRVRVRARDGRWATLHVAPVRAGLSGGSVIIIEPSRPHEIADVLVRAHGLSARESDVALAVARGASTGEIAADLHISTHTVRDHLKAVFAKVGVGTRPELVAALFHQHYADRVFGTTH